ncbi:MAG TPA: hypothetical protein VJU61_05850, partial [Polyangiaceae bacterium]|nr:hypothetical protein [Polyangiaceae bacterium]
MMRTRRRVVRSSFSLGLPLLGLLAAGCSASGSSTEGSTVIPPGVTAEPAREVTQQTPGQPVAPATPVGDPSFSDEDIEGVQDRCNELGAQFEKIVPSVVVLVDRSKSMFENNSGPVRAALWDPLADALTNATDGVIPLLESEVRFGFAAYNSDAAQVTAACPSLASVPISLDNGAAISTAYAAAGVVPNGYYKWDTPTAESVRAVTAELTQLAEPGPK